ncbi:MAG: translation initiation factor IF-2 N-terminal domain-containing protein, partial [Planctomycetota bacterium]
SARADRSGRRGDRRGGGRYGTDAGGYSRRRTSIRGRGANTAAPRKETIKLELPCSLREFCEAGGVQMGQVLKTAMMMQMPININSTLDLETADLLATELGVEIELKDHETLETELISAIEARVDDESETEVRPPIITFLGHVDHGKTSLLDALIGIDVAAKEAGGITQHIRAYESEGPDGAAITFVDTPGHEAFTEMRARGANVTDIAVLVIAADDGIMPQTEEAIAHAKAAEVPIVVAMNKIDLEGVDRNRVLTQMTEHQLIPSEWGGDVEVVGTSAITGEGMDDLRETILTVAELYELKANPNREGLGVCLEARQEGDRGVSAKVIVQNGTLSVGDVVVCGDSYGKVRAMYDPLSKQGLQSAGPSTPVD